MESTLIALLALALVLGMWWKLDRDRKREHNMAVVLSRLDRRPLLAPILHKSVDEAGSCEDFG